LQTQFKKERDINPILPAHSADPWMIFHEGFYYYCESRRHQRIYIRRSQSLAAIGEDLGVCVWSAPSFGPNSNAVWAPELHYINGKWFIYFAADNGKNKYHRMWVLESEGADPLGPYHCRGQLETGGWAIDGTVLTTDDGLYFIWSGWPGARNGRQNLYIAPMSDPLTVSGSRVLLSSPEHPWERIAMPICEAPQVLKRNGRIFIVYSASASWTVDYCLGLLAHGSGDLLDPKSWEKRGPVFHKTEDVWGVGHCSFVTSPCLTEDWIVYHSKSSQAAGWHDRDVHAKRFTWSHDGTPIFGQPLSRKTALHPLIDGMPVNLSVVNALSCPAVPPTQNFANA
jgi:GH43 family beta-xylosidase